MAKLGAAQTDSFSIGTAELRIGPMTLANKLTQANSVGLIDDAAANFTTNKVELKGGFPAKVVASAVTEVLGSVKATLREFTRNNLSIMLGNGAASVVTNVATTVTADLAANAATATVALSTGLTVGDIVTIYTESRPESVSVVKLTSVATGTIGFAANSLSQAYAVADGVINVYKANPISLGAVTRVNYFSASLVQSSPDGQPTFWNFWKCSAMGTTDYTTNAKDYASMKLDLQVLEPVVADTASGGDLFSIASLVSVHPMGIMSIGG